MEEKKMAPDISEKVTLEAEPAPVEIAISQTGVVIVDMQNAFVSKGAFVDLRGFDVTAAQATIKPTNEMCRAARARNCKVIFIVTAHYPEDAGTGPDSVYWHKEQSLTMYREHPEYKDKLLLPNTWGAEIAKELVQEKDDIVVEKPRYSAFFDTNLDTVLKRYNIKYLLVTGVATNNCVEATVRDAYYRGYFPILASDAAAAVGPPFMQEASMHNIRSYYGWVTTSDKIIQALRQP
ncbi:isochorismatase family protein [Bacteroidota bacterium]